MYGRTVPRKLKISHAILAAYNNIDYQKLPHVAIILIDMYYNCMVKMTNWTMQEMEQTNILSVH